MLACRVDTLSKASLVDDPLAASTAFHAEVLPALLHALADGAESLTLIFTPASHAHGDWRKAAIATLARETAPVRINGIASADEEAIAAALDYLERAPGVTGHYLPLDGVGAGPVVG